MRRVLLVDDEDSLRMTLAANLELGGFEVVEAQSGEEALERAKEQPFDLVLTDIRMPGISGVDLFRELRLLRPQLPVVLMTAFALEELVEGALEDGAFTLLPKPFDVEHALKVATRAASLPLVLVVDDTERVATSTAEALRLSGIRANAVTDGSQVLAAVEAGGVDVCVLDMVMPSMDGAEVAARLKAAHPDVVIIAVSGHEVGPMLQRIAALGMHTFLKKPYRVQELVRAIARARGGAPA